MFANVGIYASPITGSTCYLKVLSIEAARYSMKHLMLLEKKKKKKPKQKNKKKKKQKNKTKTKQKTIDQPPAKHKSQSTICNVIN